MKSKHGLPWKLLLLSLTLTGYPLGSSFAYVETAASACTPIDFRNTFPMKIRNQGNLSWCFAHAAADYLQYTYQVNEQVSAADIAINYFQTGTSKLITFFQRLFSKELRREPPQTGFINRAIKKILPQGYCPESVLPSERWTRIDSVTGERKSIDLLNMALDLYSLQKQVKQKKIRNSYQLPWRVDLKNISQDQLFYILKKSSQGSLLLNIRNAACKNERKPFPHIPIEHYFIIRGRHAFERINSSFNHHMPVAVDFFAGVLDNYHHFKKRIGDLHTTILYGRKFDPKTNECTYLMKNSYGESCEGYPSELRCEKGYLWFPESKLHRALTSETFMRRL